MKNNYNLLMNLNYKYSALPKLILFFLLICILLAWKTHNYSIFFTHGIYENNLLILDIDINDSDKINNAKFLKINNSKYDYIIKSISELKNNGVIMYQTYEIQINLKLNENEIVEATFYYDYERILKKIIKDLF